MKNPDADTLLYHLKKYPNHAQVHKMFITLFEIIWEMARQANIFDIRKRYNVAIDFTEWFFYGDKSSFMVVGKEPERGTASCYKFITINIVEAGKRFTLLALPVSALDNVNKDKLIRTLLSYALQRIKIRQVYVDRGFFDSKVLKMFEHFHLKYLMPGIQQYNIKQLLNVIPAPSVVNDFYLKDVKINLVFLEKELENGNIVKWVYATNEDYDSKEIDLLEKIFDLYGKRWGIESSYRVKKQYLPKTTSKNYLIRLFYFMFAVLLYNLWILADILIWLALFGIVEEDHLITSKYFGTVLYTIDPGG
jgi:putative transposase